MPLLDDHQRAEAEQSRESVVAAAPRSRAARRKDFAKRRSTRETELTERSPVHVACQWVGNSPKAATRHYLQTTDEHFARAVRKAVQNPVQYSSESSRTEPQTEHPGEADRSELATIGLESGKKTALGASQGLHRLPPRGFEPLSPG